MSSFQLIFAREPADIATVGELWGEYAAWLAIDLALPEIARDAAGLPGKYQPPGGELLLARSPSGTPLGCIALRPLDTPASCEIKRLYVRPAGRQQGIGRALVASIVDVAARLGYHDIKLDTLPRMTAAIAIYEAHGFRQIPAYWNNLVPDVIYLGRRL